MGILDSSPVSNYLWIGITQDFLDLKTNICNIHTVCSINATCKGMQLRYLWEYM